MDTLLLLLIVVLQFAQIVILSWIYDFMPSVGRVVRKALKEKDGSQ